MITGRIEFKDETNGLTAWYEFGDGGKKKNPKDYLKGQILKGKTEVCSIFGNMMGFLEFNGQRYWDVRYSPSFVPQSVPRNEKTTPSNSNSLNTLLASDTTLRADSMALLAGEIEQAQ